MGLNLEELFVLIVCLLLKVSFLYKLFLFIFSSCYAHVVIRCMTRPREGVVMPPRKSQNWSHAKYVEM